MGYDPRPNNIKKTLRESHLIGTAGILGAESKLEFFVCSRSGYSEFPYVVFRNLK
jgi:hypothetical protein